MPQVYPIAARPAIRLKRITTNDHGECPRVVTTAFSRGKSGAVKSEISPSTYPSINERITLYDNHGIDIEAIHHPRFHSLTWKFVVLSCVEKGCQGCLWSKNCGRQPFWWLIKVRYDSIGGTLKKKRYGLRIVRFYFL